MPHNDPVIQMPFRSTFAWLISKLRALPVALRIVLLTLVVGYITHGFVYANTLLAHDNIHLFVGDGIATSRWSQQLFYFFRARLQMPWVIGLISMLELGVVNVLLTEMLSLRRLSSQVLLVLTVVTFPAVISFHNYGSVDLFTGPMLVAVLAVYLSARKGWGNWLLSVALLAIGIAGYQAFVSTAATLMLLLLLARIVIRQDDAKAVWLDGLKALLILCASVAVYYGVVTALLQSDPSASLAAYRSQNAMGVFTMDELLKWTRDAYDFVWQFYATMGIGPLPRWLSALQLGLLAFVGLATAVRLFGMRFYRHPGRLLLVLVILLLLPLAMNSIQVFNNGVQSHSLMTFAFIAPWLLVLQYGEWLVDQIQAPKGPAGIMKKVLPIACAAVMGVNSFYCYVLANADYLSRKMNYDASISLATRIVDRIETTEGYEPSTPVIIVGAPIYSSYYLRPRAGFELMDGIIGSYNTGQAMVYNVDICTSVAFFISTVLSSNMVFVESSQMTAYANMEEVVSLPSFPAKDCYTWIDDVLVVKLSD